MFIRLVFATLHLVGMGIGVSSIWARARGLRGTLDASGVRQVLLADNFWGLSALLLIATGLVRAFAGLEKGAAYYVHNHFFWEKMTLLIIILSLEIWPMVTFIQWRVAGSRDFPIDTRRARLFAWISTAQLVLLIGMVLIATGLARGLGN